MNNQNQTTYDLCIIGMGISGLNALESASKYLPASARVIVVDRQQPENAIGGMWHNVYKYVRLHQPHPLFTIGNRKWNLKKDASHLASREEILNHFETCYRELHQKFTIEEKFACEYVSHEEVNENGNYRVDIRFRSVNDPEQTLQIKADRCIKAFGFNVSPNSHMTFDTDKVHSLAPESDALSDGTVAKDQQPIYIIGGGKTSMDVAALILSQNPDRKFNFVIGKGMYFMDRDKFFPEGMSRYWKGKSVSDSLIDMYRNYDENDLESSIAYVKEQYGLAPAADASQTLLGLLSPKESAPVVKATEHFIYDYLSDVIETDDQLEILFRSGERRAIPAGSWIINCTSHLYPDRADVTEPIVSEQGRVLSIHKSVSAFFFTSIAGYFLPHLWYRDQFRKVPILYFDHHQLVKKNKSAYLFAIAAQVIHNQLRCVEALPLKTVMDCGLNYDKWFPLVRQMPVLVRLLKNKKTYLRESAGTLKAICEKYEVDYGIVGR